jgi:hypothetical protein
MAVRVVRLEQQLPGLLNSSFQPGYHDETPLQRMSQMGLGSKPGILKTEDLSRRLDERWTSPSLCSQELLRPHELRKSGISGFPNRQEFLIPLSRGLVVTKRLRCTC